MLAPIAIGKAIALPILFALGLGLLLRRSANSWCLLAAFLAGILGAYSLNESLLRNLPAFLPDDQLQVATAGQAWLSGFVEAGIPEELSKGMWTLVFLVGWRQYAAQHGAIIGGLIGLGFALRENLSYAQTLPEWRILGALSHAEWGVIMGSLLQHAVFDSTRRSSAIVWAFSAPILLHGLLDTSVFLVEACEPTAGINQSDKPSSPPVSFAILSVMLLTAVIEITSLAWAIRLIRRLRRLPTMARVLDPP